MVAGAPDQYTGVWLTSMQESPANRLAVQLSGGEEGIPSLLEQSQQSKSSIIQQEELYHN